jgi:hypothetical protein
MGCRVGTGAKSSRDREIWSVSQNTPYWGVADSPNHRNPKVSHSANAPHAARLVATFHGNRFMRERAGWER